MITSIRRAIWQVRCYLEIRKSALARNMGMAQSMRLASRLTRGETFGATSEWSSPAKVVAEEMQDRNPATMR